MSFRRPNSRRRQAQRSSTAVGWLPVAERLEDRVVLSTFVVTTLLDSGAGSLRQAVTDANAAGDADTITFDSALAGTISLSTIGDTTFGSAGLLVSSPVTIEGDNGAAGVTIGRDSGTTMRLFTVASTGSLTLNDITLADGRALGGTGGAGRGGGGGGAGFGGAVFNAGTLAVTRSTLTGNTAQGGSGGGGLVGSYGGGGGGLGGDGGIGNPPTGGGPNGGTGGSGGTAGGNGGVGGGGGGSSNSGSAPGDGGFGGGGGGGGSGFAGFGGDGGFGGGGGWGTALGNGGFGGGNASTGFSTGGGGAGMGGAVFNYGGTVTLTNATLTGNAAVGGGGGFNASPGSGFGGAVFNYNGSITLLQATVFDNTAAQGGTGVYSLGNAGTAAATVDNTIVANATGLVSSFTRNAINGGTSTTTGDGNLVRNHVNFTGTIVTSLAPQLGALAANGGPTRTLLPANSSPAVGIGINASAAGLTLDQRGVPRLVGTFADAGAVELTVAPVFASPSTTSFAEANAGTFTVTTTSSAPVAAAVSFTGTLPTGVTFTDNGDGTATLAGTPPTGLAGSYPLTFSADNGFDAPVTQAFTLEVKVPPAITSVATTTFALSATGTFTVTTSGDATVAITKVGALPSGVTLTDNGDGTATIAGTPTQGGAFLVTLRASNGFGADATQAFTLGVNAAPSITSAASTTFVQGTAGTFTVTTNGFPTAALSVDGTLPAGVTFDDNADGTATLAMTAAADISGAYNFTINATNTTGTAAPQAFTLTVNRAPTIVAPASIALAARRAFNQTISTTGFPTATLALTGTLPGGLTFIDNGDGTGAVQGTPTLGSVGTYAVTITATNGVGTPAVANVTITVVDPPVVVQSYAAQLSVDGKRIAALTVTFGDDLNVAPAGTAFTLYKGSGARLAAPSPRATIKIASVAYDATTRTATVVPVKPLKSTGSYVLVVNSVAVVGINGKALDGAENGVAGSPYALRVSRGRTLSYRDADNDLVTLRLKGPGTLQIDRGATGEGRTVLVTGSTSATTLSGSVKRGRGGASTTTLVGITGLPSAQGQDRLPTAFVVATIT